MDLVDQIQNLGRLKIIEILDTKSGLINQMDLQITIQHIQNLTGNPETPEFQQSWGIIEAFRKSDLASFLLQMIQIYSNIELASAIRQLAIILSYQPFPTSVEDPKQNPFLALNIPDEVITQLLSSSSNCFSDEIINIRIGAANLFSRIACIDVLTLDKFGITKTLITGFTSPTSVQAFESISTVLIDLFLVSVVHDDELNTILSALFGYLSSQDQNVTSVMKQYCLKILCTIIDNMAEILTDDDNVKSLFAALFAMSSNPETKAEAFRCWTQFAINFYPMLELVAQQIAESSFVELTQDESDRETIINICVFWKSIAECESTQNAELHIINQIANILLPLLFKISVKIPFDQCDNQEDYEPHIAAATAIQAIVATSPEQSMPVLLKFVHEFAMSEGGENFALREGALNCLNFIIQFCDCSPILIESLSLIYNGLNDSSPRVKQTAVYCVHAILNSILKKGDSCPFAALIPQIGLKIVHLSTLVMNLMIGNVDVNLASTAASATADFIQFPGFPYTGKALSLLLMAAVRSNMPDSFILSQSAFSSLQDAVLRCPNQLLQPVMGAILQIMKESIVNHSDFWIINQICILLQAILVRLTGEINEESIQLSWSLFETTFNQYPDEAAALLSPLSSLARAAGQSFPYLNVVAEFILHGLENYESAKSIPSAALGASFLSDCFDLSPFAMKFLEALTKALANSEIPLESKRFAAGAIGDLATKAPQVFIEVAPNVLEPLVSVCENDISNIIAVTEEEDDDELLDDFDIDDIVSSFLSCLQKVMLTLAQNNQGITSKVADTLIDLLESVGGMNEHGDKLLKTSVEAMVALIQLFPGQMKETLNNEPGFIVILQESQGAEILLPAIQMIYQFMSNQ